MRFYPLFSSQLQSCWDFKKSILYSSSRFYCRFFFLFLTFYFLSSENVNTQFNFNRLIIKRREKIRRTCKLKSNLLTGRMNVGVFEYIILLCALLTHSSQLPEIEGACARAPWIGAHNVNFRLFTYEWSFCVCDFLFIKEIMNCG